MPLVKGRYPVQNGLQSILGNLPNVAQANSPIRSNAEYLGLASAADGAALVTNKLVCVAVPVDIGATYSKVTFIAGATAPTTTHVYGAVYSGLATAATSLLLAQSTDGVAAAPTASQANSFTLATPQVATGTNAPQGFWFVGIQETGTANSALSVSVAAAVQVFQTAVFLNAPFALSFNVAATTGTAPANLGTPTTATVTPLVFLS
jgi:hypothetical protein